MKIKFREKEQKSAQPQSMVSSAERVNGKEIFRLAPTAYAFEQDFYETLRSQVPILDACIGKIVRLTGGFKLVCEDERYQSELDEFIDTIPVGISGYSLNTFVDIHLDQLLTYGKAIGEILIDPQTKQVCGLYNADPTLFEVKYGKTPCDKRICAISGANDKILEYPERIIYSALNPNPKNPNGISVFRGLPSLAGILMKVYDCIGQNFDRVGNIRYAVTYKPANENDKAFAKERAMQIAKEWSDGMNASKNGIVKDFVAVGDVDIKVIGADNQVIDTEIPVRQILEQMISKLCIPPFLLGLNWSTTERMSQQQCDILTSELEYYRRLLTPIIRRICETYLHLLGADSRVFVQWDNINLQDESELAKARLYNAQAEAIEIENERRKANEDEIGKCD